MLDAAFQCLKYFLSPLQTVESVTETMQKLKKTKTKQTVFYYNGVIFRHNIILKVR